MKIFQPLYDAMLRWSAHPRAVWLLSVLSFAESTFFPIPPDVMLAPMTLSRPEKAWHYAFWCTLMSVLGGLAGYALGSLAFDWIEPWLQSSGNIVHYETGVSYFQRWGVWVILLAGFSPIPYKVFTITAGALGMPLLPFFLGSAAGRAGRFYLVAGLIRLGGEKAEQTLRRNIDLIGWALVGLAVVIVVWLQLRN